MQSDQLIDAAAASIGPEPGVTYEAEFYPAVGTTPLAVESGLTGTTVTWTPPSDGVYRVELYSVRDGLTSWQKYSHIVTVGEAAVDPYWGAVVSLLHFETDFTDQIAGNTWTAYSGAYIDTADKLIGGGSYRGAGGYARLSGSPANAMGSDSATIEMWFSQTAALTWGVLFSIGKGYSSADRNILIRFYDYDDGDMAITVSGARNTKRNVEDFCSTGKIPKALDDRNHLAVVISPLVSGTRNFAVYLNGQLKASVTGQAHISLSDTYLTIGRGYWGGDLRHSGLVDELRITKGVERYTADFTPVFAPFPDQ